MFLSVKVVLTNAVRTSKNQQICENLSSFLTYNHQPLSNSLLKVLTLDSFPLRVPGGVYGCCPSPSRATEPTACPSDLKHIYILYIYIHIKGTVLSVYGAHLDTFKSEVVVRESYKTMSHFGHREISL